MILHKYSFTYPQAMYRRRKSKLTGVFFLKNYPRENGRNSLRCMHWFRFSPLIAFEYFLLLNKGYVETQSCIAQNNVFVTEMVCNLHNICFTFIRTATGHYIDFAENTPFFPHNINFEKEKKKK